MNQRPEFKTIEIAAESGSCSKKPQTSLLLDLLVLKPNACLKKAVWKPVELQSRCIPHNQLVSGAKRRHSLWDELARCAQVRTLLRCLLTGCDQTGDKNLDPGVFLAIQILLEASATDGDRWTTCEGATPLTFYHAEGFVLKCKYR